MGHLCHRKLLNKQRILFFLRPPTSLERFTFFTKHGYPWSWGANVGFDKNGGILPASSHHPGPYLTCPHIYIIITTHTVATSCCNLFLHLPAMYFFHMFVPIFLFSFQVLAYNLLAFSRGWTRLPDFILYQTTRRPELDSCPFSIFFEVFQFLSKDFPALWVYSPNFFPPFPRGFPSFLRFFFPFFSDGFPK